MKVVHILHELKFSGAEIMYVDAASVFQKKGCELTVIAGASNLGDFAPYFKRAGYKVLHKPYPKLKNYINRIKYYSDFVKFLKSENYDVVHIHSLVTMWGMSLCAWLAGKKSVRTFHSVNSTNWYSYFYHCFIRWSAKKIFKCKFQSISDSVHDHELKLYGNKTLKIENWYGSNRYFPAIEDEKNQVRKELGIAYDTLVLISVGGCNSNKRHHDIIKALPIIISRNSNVLYLHLGTGITENEEKKLSKELKVAKYVHFCGSQEEVRKYFIASDIYVMTSRTEGMPITALEAMACKIPSVFYNVTGLRDFNKKGENSILIPEDYGILADKINYLYTNPAIRKKISGNALNMVNEHFHMEINALKIYELYL